jgi:molybdopterin-binding protein
LFLKQAENHLKYAYWKLQEGGMKLSARNQLAGKVVAVVKGQTTAHEAVDELTLTVGDEVTAVIKSSDVMIGK